MSSALNQPGPITISRYLICERASETSNKFVRGEIFAMAGDRESQRLIATSTAGEIHAALKRTLCRVYDSNLRVGVVDRPRYRYPVVLVISLPLREIFAGVELPNDRVVE